MNSSRSSRSRIARLAALCVVFCSVLAGCTLAVQSPRHGRAWSRDGRGEPLFEPADGAPAYAPVPPGGVAVYRLDDVKHLPPGVWPPSSRPARADALGYVVLEPDFPTAADPHRKLGVLTVYYDDATVGRDPYELLASEAGRRGANAIVVTTPRLGSAVRAIALHLSNRAPGPYESAATLLARTPAELGGYTLVGDATRDLAHFEPLEIAGKRGTCYAVHFALDGTSALDTATRYWLLLAVDHVGGAGSLPLPEELGSHEIGRNLPMSFREHTTAVGCPVSDRLLRVRFAGANQGHDVFSYGTGTIRFAVYARPIDLAELDRMSERVKEKVQVVSERMEEHRQAVERDCGRCARELRRCPDGSEASCEPYTRCLLMSGRQTSDCH